MTVLSLDHYKINIRNVRRSLAFYEGLLGFKVVANYTLPKGNLIKISPNGRPPMIELLYHRGRSPRAPRAIHIGLLVSSTERTVARLRRRRVPIAEEPHQLGCAIIAFIKDPDGHLIELLGPLPPPQRS